MMVVLRFLIWAFIGAVLILFAVSNRTPVTLGLWPFTTQISAPPWLILFAGIFIGLIVAGLVTGWIRLKGFVARRQLARREAELRSDVDRLSESVHRTEARDAMAAIEHNQDGSS